MFLDTTPIKAIIILVQNSHKLGKASVETEVVDFWSSVSVHACKFLMLIILVS